ncbi:hypothetical protein APX70_00014 [Pseudomonas syringae pv. maculicola]|uniref:Uncharacterized protein n=1 Tax=Pseudomonas syringae pv. maculicola TaxID=59511 RepID=A0A3M2UTX7_PSEYM|nr:hypothetical protein APX70_00014 [Pseudomonas syringae pv. maculicola]
MMKTFLMAGAPTIGRYKAWLAVYRSVLVAELQRVVCPAAQDPHQLLEIAL